jgi:hypothetical protein
MKKKQKRKNYLERAHRAQAPALKSELNIQNQFRGTDTIS